jgi:hypothetical protein
VLTVTFANDGTEIVATCEDGTARRYHCEIYLPLPKLVELASSRLARELADDERQRYVTQGALLGRIMDRLLPR